ncbi:MAG: thiamine phosphate synthase [Xanthobacter sp.]
MSDSELPPARLMLILPAGPDLEPARLEAAVKAGDVAALIFTMAAPAPSGTSKLLRRLAAPLQAQDVAILVTDAAEVVGPAGLDGLHVSLATPEPLEDALSALKPEGIVGAGGLTTRHETMEAGESGADYVMFGPLAPVPEDAAHIREMVNWWAELCEVPCIGVATSLDDVEALAQEGADFVALAASLLTGPEGVDMARQVAAAQARLEAGHATRLSLLPSEES